jgi:hypothetical protein
MLGSAADAEDALQETWLRWTSVDLGTVRDQRAHLVQINGALDTVIAVRFDEDLISGLYAVRNPEKLFHMERETNLRR